MVPTVNCDIAPDIYNSRGEFTQLDIEAYRQAANKVCAPRHRCCICMLGARDEELNACFVWLGCMCPRASRNSLQRSLYRTCSRKSTKFSPDVHARALFEAVGVKPVGHMCCAGVLLRLPAATAAAAAAAVLPAGGDIGAGGGEAAAAAASVPHPAAGARRAHRLNRRLHRQRTTGAGARTSLAAACWSLA